MVSVGLLDNLIAALSPRRAYEREMWRQGLDELRGYDAAGHGRINSGWRAVNESAEITDRYSRDVVRARARDLERNSDIAQSVIYAYKRNVVGKGYTLRAMTGSDELDKRIEKAWKRWCKARNCDVTGEQSFNEILRMMVERKKVDGGMIVLYRYTPGGVVPSNFNAWKWTNWTRPRQRHATRATGWWAVLSITNTAARWATGSANMT